MNRRGRPPWPDVLTPREWEVLAHVRQGLTNREIAERLGISLSGAKHHVSEIITKLGVESREEAAMWQREPEAARRWAGVPLLAGLRLPSLLAGGIASKYVVAATVPLIAIALTAGAWASGVTDGGENDATSRLAASPTADPSCPAPKCFRLEPERLTTLQDVIDRASFVPLTVHAMPAGFEQQEILYWRYPATGSEAPDPKAVHNDWVTMIYRNSDGKTLAISQGFGVVAGLGMCNAADKGISPWPKPGIATIQARQACWMEDVPFNLIADRLPNSGLMLAFQIGRFGTGWAISPEGSYFSGSPMSMSFISDGLNLEQLTAIAESVKLPSMSPALNGATPERGW